MMALWQARVTVLPGRSHGGSAGPAGGPGRVIPQRSRAPWCTPCSASGGRTGRWRRSTCGRLGLYPGQELLLLQLAEGERRSQQELVDALGIDHSTVTKMLQRLERAGVVARQQSANDRRVVLVHLTEEGCVQRRAVEEMWARMEAATSGGLSEEQHAQLLELLHRVEGYLDQLDQR